MSTFAASVIEHALAHLGDDVVWTPSGGAPVTVRAARRSPDAVSDFADSRLLTETALLEFRTTDVAPNGLSGSGAIAEGDAVAVGGQSRVVQGDPYHPDPRRLKVLVETRAA